MRAIFLWLIVSLLMIFHFFLMLSLGVITSQVRTALNLSAFELSLLSSSYLYIYILLQTPAGIMLDAYGAKKLLTAGAVVASIGCLIFAFSDSLIAGMVGRALSGGGYAFVFVAAVQLANRWFPERYFGMMLGLAESAGMLGAIFSNMLLAFCMGIIGWRESFSFAAVCSLALAIASWATIRDYPKSVVPKAKQKLTWNRIKLNIGFAINEPQVWLNSLYICLMYVVITVFSGLWANPFLRRTYNMSLEESTFASCLILAGLCIGSPIIGALFDSTKRRAFLIIKSPIIMFFLICLIIYVYIPWYNVLCVLMFLLGVSGSSLIQSYAIVSEISPDGVKSTSIGFTNTIALISAILVQPFIGWLLNKLSSVTTGSELEYYSVADYRIALTIIPMLVALAYMVGKWIAKDLMRTETVLEQTLYAQGSP